MKSVRAPGKALAGICSVTWIIPSPAGCFVMTATSPGPETVYVMPVSSPLSENTERSNVVLPLAGRCNGIGLPESEQELFTTENIPRAATLMSTSLPCALTPAVVGSTTTTSLPVTAGDALLRAITSSDVFGGTTMRETALDFVPSGFSICTETVPAIETSAGASGAVHSVAAMHAVVRAVPPIIRVDPGPGLDAAKPLPATSNVKPSAAPAKTLAGCSERMLAPLEIVTFAAPDCVVSSELMATTFRASGVGAEPGAV